MKIALEITEKSKEMPELLKAIALELKQQREIGRLMKQIEYMRSEDDQNDDG